ncbi:nucleotidyltransferase family protein [Nostoc sp. UCD121]|uniref:nucleotidyltransferase domain-containing protein n=1 Tax=unclassified Nostoc TaxID=2593658 RepID=UPI0016286633|nr:MULTISPECIES: nucleotidyltransferase family protein [unclassified Nostoc]MBC1224356.1 nucleotidyltransferase family protein [Nostoc sp. UCD120]MBC1279552.1 nucleotidyltransferase family protein [Nostoc sp. UCD121]MBC1296451.1 nucleotidyltransferase family protein [Nostoc sp. UCD122]
MTTLIPSHTKESVATNPEIDLLVCCVRTCIDSKTAERIKTLLQQEIDWTYLIHLASRHGVMPLLYQSLNTCPEVVPKTILGQLRSYFHANALHNLFLTQELLKLLELFQENNIRAIAYKGPVLAASVYGNLSLRQFSDLDILVHEQDFLKAKDLLILGGYQSGREFDWEHTFVSADSTYTVDLHQGITRQKFPFRLDFDRLWLHLEPLSLAGTTVVNLSPEDLLMILCVQIAKDCDEQLQQLSKICDIAQLLGTHPTLNWELVMEQASQLGSERLVFFGLWLTSEIFGTVLPDEVRQKIQLDQGLKLYSTLMYQRFFCEVDKPMGVFDTFLKNLMLMKCPPHKVLSKRYLVWYFLRLAIAPNVRDQQFMLLPRPLYFLYFLLRPIRLVDRYGLNVFRHLLGGSVR